MSLVERLQLLIDERKSAAVADAMSRAQLERSIVQQERAVAEVNAGLATVRRDLAGAIERLEEELKKQADVVAELRAANERAEALRAALAKARAAIAA